MLICGSHHQINQADWKNFKLNLFCNILSFRNRGRCSSRPDVTGLSRIQVGNTLEERSRYVVLLCAFVIVGTDSVAVCKKLWWTECLTYPLHFRVKALLMRQSCHITLFLPTSCSWLQTMHLGLGSRSNEAKSPLGGAHWKLCQSTPDGQIPTSEQGTPKEKNKSSAVLLE